MPDSASFGLVKFPRRQPAALLAALVLSGCGSAAGRVEVEGVAGTTVERLLAVADASAQDHNGRAERVEAVLANRSRVTGDRIPDGDEPVWVLQISGDHYVCGLCRIAPLSPRKAPEGDYISVVLGGTNFEVRGGGFSSQAEDLTALGDVLVLRGAN